MKIIVGGTPSSGKTRAILALARDSGFGRMGVVKLDCVATTDDHAFAGRGIRAISVLAGKFCPDHLLVEKWPELCEWAAGNDLGTLVVETAGLCGRCAPYMRSAVAVCVLDCTAGIQSPRKLGPLLLDADVMVFSKGDLVSQAERDVFVAQARIRNPRATGVMFNGLTGEGGWELARVVHGHVPAHGESDGLRTVLPQMYCSYCLGRMEAGVRAM